MIEDFLNYIANNILVYGLLVQLLAVLLSLYFVPIIRKLALVKNLTDTPSARKSHKTEVPVLGGVAVYLAATFAMLVVAYIFPSKIESSDFFLLGVVSLVLLFIGILDDTVGLKVSHRFLIQTFLALLVILKGNIFIFSMDGLFGLYELSTTVSLVLSLFVYLVFMNMLNLIDGIDGLAAGVSTLAFFFFAGLAFFSENYHNMLIAMASLGSLIPFLYFNIFSKRKIFLGDNGSLVLGAVLGYLTLDFLSNNNSFSVSLLEDHIILILMCLFSYPLVDTLRVFTIRIFRRRNPFSADKNHIHHHLLRLGFSHRKATLVVIVYTLFIISVSFLVKGITINLAFVLLLLFSVLVICLPSFLIKNEDGTIFFF